MTESTAAEHTSAAGRYEELRGERDAYLERARDAAKLTIPTLMPPDGWDGKSRLPTPFQSMGSRGVNTLSAKLVLALMPPNSPFFRMTPDSKLRGELDALSNSEDENERKLKTEIESALADYEREAQTEIEVLGDRVTIGEAARQLVNAGNVLLYTPDNERARYYKLDKYVVLRDPAGSMMEMILKESVDVRTLPLAIREQLQAEKAKTGSTEDPKATNKNVAVYTWVKRTDDGKFYEAHQEIDKIKVDSTKGRYKIEECPWLPLRWTKLDGEHYGRGFVEEHIGDLISLESLMTSIVQGSAAAAKVLVMVSPNGSTSKDAVEKSDNGAVITGSAEDVTFLQMQKYGDFRVARETIMDIQQRLAAAFLLTQSVQRDAERVTAEEIRIIAQELEDSLGGVYSILSQEFQLPYIRSRLSNMKLPKLPNNVRPVIITGLEALGRGHDLQKLRTFIGVATEMLGPEQVAAVVNPSDALTRVATAIGLNTKGLIKSDAQVAQERQQAMMQQMMQQFGPEVIKQGGQMMQNQQQAALSAEQAPPAA
jgi:hypothetical protein